MSDSITILKHATNRLAKTWLADGSIKAYDDAKYFTQSTVAVNSIEDLSAVLSRLERDSRACVIRGAYAGDEQAQTIDPEYNTGRVRRILDLFSDAPRHWMLVEVDNFEPLTADPVNDPVRAIDEYIHSSLPACFHGASYHWQLSNSAGHLKNVDKLKAHVWFWLDTPYTGASLKHWAQASAVDLDKSVFNAVQIHYTAAPVFEEGVVNPVPVRSGFVEGLLCSSVALEIDTSAVSDVRETRLQRLASVSSEDPVAVRLSELGLVKSQGKKGELFINCPLSENHTSESGDTSTTYYPAHTGGYARGAFVCLHEHCNGVPQSVFLDKIGIDPVSDDFSDLTVSEDISKNIPEALHMTTDQANAVRIIKRYGQRLMVASDRWYAWVGTHWAQDDASVYRLALSLSKMIRVEADAFKVKRGDSPKEWEKNVKIADALEAWAKKSEMKSTIEAALGLAKRMLSVPVEDLDASPWLLNCANGTVDLRTGAIKAHDPNDYITRMVTIAYNPSADTTLIRSIVSRITCEEGESQQPLAGFMRRWFGYCATGSVREQKFAVHYGTGRNGKSTIIDAVTDVLGPYAATAAPGLLMSGGKDRHPTEIADLLGRRLVTAHETSDGGVLREEFVKQATGGDKIKARYMRGDFFEFLPTHKLQMLTNYKPVIKGQDEGIWRRVLLLPYKAKFGTAEEVAEGRATYERDTKIVERLTNAQEGTLAWLVAGAVEWYRDGLNPPSIVLEASKDYQTEQDRVLQFANEECEIGRDFEEKLSTPFNGGLYPSYTTWCKLGGMHALSKNRFLVELERCVPFFAKKKMKDLSAEGKRREFVVICGLRLIDADM